MIPHLTGVRKGVVRIGTFSAKNHRAPAASARGRVRYTTRMHVDIYSDGSRLDLAGPVGWACEVVHQGRRWHESGVIASASLILAEAHGARCGVALALHHGATALDLFLDAQIVIDLIEGRHHHLLTDPALAACVAQIQAWRTSHALRLHKVKAHSGGCSGNSWVDGEARRVLNALRVRRG